MDSISVLFVDDHKMFTEVWSAILNTDQRFCVVGAAANAEDAYQIVEKTPPRIALVDINMIPVNGFEITKRIRELSTSTKVICVSCFSITSYAKKMMREGASGYVTKNSSKEELINAIIEVDKGSKYICDEIKDLLVLDQFGAEDTATSSQTLTKAELNIIRLIQQGLSSKEIAISLNIAVKTVEVHRYNILKKLKLKNTASLINYVYLKGIY